MAQNQEKQTFLQAKLCIKCTSMYGHPSFQDMCSICFKKEKAQQKQQQHALLEKPVLEQKIIKQEVNLPPLEDVDSKKRTLPTQVKEEKCSGKCAKCQRKTKMLGYNCKHCTGEFCRLHRLPEEHQCSVDFISLGRKQIKTQNPIVAHKKIEEI